MLGKKDPIAISGPDARRALFEAFAHEASGFPQDDVLNAAANLLVNALRQQYPSRSHAALAFDEIATKAKELLMSHYDSAGRKKGIFPYDQRIELPLIDARERFPH